MTRGGVERAEHLRLVRADVHGASHRAPLVHRELDAGLGRPLSGHGEGGARGMMPGVERAVA